MRIQTRIFVAVMGLAASFLPTRAGAVAGTAELRGQVTDSVTNLPVEGATVGLDAGSGDGVFERSAETDAFGFYTITGIDAGAWQIAVNHPAFLNGQDSISLIAEEKATRDFALAPVQDRIFFDIYMQVQGAESNLPLANVPVLAERFATAGDTVPAGSFVVTTDNTGTAVFRGLESGFYNFSANDGTAGPPTRPGWMAFGTAGTANEKMLLNQPYMGNILLKPVIGDMTVTVSGYDPVEDLANQPLADMYVELTGVDPADPDFEVVPTRVGVTNGSGVVAFKKLPPIAWRVEVKRLGYDPVTQIVQPVNDVLPANLPIAINLLPTQLDVTLDSIFKGAFFMKDLMVLLQGLEDTNTDNIIRGAFSADHGGVAMVSFSNLLPGRYRLSLLFGIGLENLTFSRNSAPEPVQADFKGESYVEVMPAEANAFTFPLTVSKSITRGRLFAAEERGDLGTFSFFENDDGNPVFIPFLFSTAAFQPRAQTGIQFVPDPQLAFMLKPEFNQPVVTDTDPSGQFTVALPPGVWAVQIPAMTDYAGSHVRRRNLDTGKLVIHGWPYPVSRSEIPGSSVGTYATIGMKFEKTFEYQLDLFVRRQKMELRGLIDIAPDSDILPADKKLGDEILRLSDLANGGTATLTPTDGSPPIVVDLTTHFSGNNGTDIAEFFFKDVPPNDYNLSLNHSSGAYKFTDSITGQEGPFPMPLRAFGAPGVLPFGDVIPLEPDARFVFGFPFNVEIVKYNKLQVNIRDSDGNLEHTRDRSDLFTTDFTGATLFSGTGLLRPGTYDLYFDLNGFLWAKKQVTANGDGSTITIDLFDPGDFSTSEPPSPPYRFKIIAVNEADRAFEVVNDVVVNLPSQSNVTLPFEDPARTKGFRPGSITSTLWVAPSGVNAEVKIGGAFDVEVIVPVKRGMGVSGVVKEEGSLTPVAGARVTVRDRYGAAFQTETTDASGAWQLPQALEETKPLFIDINAPGFFPFRKRIQPDYNMNPFDVVENDLQIKPLPKPVIDAVSVDRFGLFLTGITKSGDAGAFNTDRAGDALKASWKIEATAQELIYTLPDFDAADGTTRANLNYNFEDPIVEAWIVDQRSYPFDPYKDTPVSNPIPSMDDAGAIRTWLNDIRKGGIPGKENVFSRQVGPGGVTKLVGQGDRKFEASGMFTVSDLPPGEFQPVLIVFSQRGAAKAMELTYGTAEAKKKLRGTKLPPWMGFLSDVIGVSAGISATQDELMKFLPKGRFIPLPNFTATISAGDMGADTGFMTYEYGLKVGLFEGQEGGSSGILGYAQGSLGLNVSVDLTAKASGPDDKLSLTLGTNISSKEIDVTEYVPKAVPKSLRKKVASSLDASVKAFGSVTTDASSIFNASDFPNEFQLTHKVQGGFAGTASYNLIDPLFSKIPYAGPFLLILNKTGNLDLNAILEAAAGVVSTTTWTTLYPRVEENPSGGGTTTQNLPAEIDHVHRRHAFGGQERPPLGTAQTSFNQQFALCFNFGVGLEIDAAGGRLGGSGKIFLAGNDNDSCALNAGGDPIDSAKITFNPAGDWPLISRVSGSLKASIEAFLDLYVKRFTKTWETQLLSFDYQFGTDPRFQLVPLNIAVTVETLANFSPAILTGNGPELGSSIFPLSAYAVAGNGIDAILFSDLDGNGNVKLSVILRTGPETWSAPGDLATAAAIIDTALVALPDNRFMAVWVEIASGDVDLMAPPSTIRYALSDAAGGNWTAPADLAALPDLASNLKLASGPNFTALFYLRTGNGPTSDSFSINGSQWNGVAWETPVELLAETPLIAHDAAVCGTANQAAVAYLTGQNELTAFTWNGAAAASPSLLNAAAGNDFSLTAGEADACYLAWTPQTGGISLFKYDSTNGWAALADPFPDAIPAELKTTYLPGGTEDALLLAWTEGGDVASVHYGFSNLAGTVLRDAANLTANSVGRYFDLALLPRANQEATITSRFEINPLNFRRFDVSLATGGINNDSDADLMNDVGELLVVDADTIDAINRIEDVLPDDDFDLDGFSNAVEIEKGTDPADAASFPDVNGVIVEATSPTAREFGLQPGRFTFTRPSANIANPLTVQFAVAGDAASGIDYQPFSSSIDIQPTQTTAALDVVPLADTLAEGDESITLTVQADPAYTVGTPAAATVTLEDLPADDWRKRNFPADPNAPDASDAADPDSDGLPNLLEFALFLGPDVPDTIALPSIRSFDDGSGNRFLELTYQRALEALDLLYTVEVSSDLVNWRSNGDGLGPDVTDPESVAPIDPNREQVTVRSKTRLQDGSREFIRLKVTRIAPPS